MRTHGCWQFTKLSFQSMFNRHHTIDLCSVSSWQSCNVNEYLIFHSLTHACFTQWTKTEFRNTKPPYKKPRCNIITIFSRSVKMLYYLQEESSPNFSNQKYLSYKNSVIDFNILESRENIYVSIRTLNIFTLCKCTLSLVMLQVWCFFCCALFS